MAGPIPSIALLLLPRFTLAPFALVQDVLRLAADEGDRSRPLRLSWTTISAGGAPVMSSAGVEVAAQAALGHPARFDYVVVCGGLLERGHRDDPVVEAWLRDAHASGVVIAGLCTGSFMLAQAGLLEGRRACINWFHVADFEQEHPHILPLSTHRLIEDDGVVTCAGGAGAADLGAWIVGRHLGEAVARKALDILMIDSHGGLQPRPAMADIVRDTRLKRIVLLLEERIAQSPNFAHLAREVGMSRRQLERLFKADTGRGPAAFLAAMRLRYADWMMRTSTVSMTHIAMACGFADPGHLSRRYSAAFGMPPSQARRLGGFEGGERRPYGDAILPSVAPR